MNPAEPIDKEISIDADRLDREISELLAIGNLYTDSIDRIVYLVDTSKKLEGVISENEYFRYHVEIFRASVIFLHSILETTIREIMRKRLKELSSTNLPKIPLAGLNSRSDRFTLADLNVHRGKSVIEVVEESIDEYFDTMSFNSANEIMTRLNSIEFDVSRFKDYLKDINTMIMRRHKIVHEADYQKLEGDTFVLDEISFEDIQVWLRASSDFIRELVFEAIRTAPYQKEIREAINIS